MALEIGSLWTMALKEHNHYGREYKIISAGKKYYTIAYVSIPEYSYSLVEEDIYKYFKRINENYWEV